jgi:hypothetical protein
MTKSETKIDEAGLEKSLDKLRSVIEKMKSVRGKIDELRKDIRLEIVRDGLLWDPNLSFSSMVQHHREWNRGHGQAQFLATKLPPLVEEEGKLSDEAKVLIKEIAKHCGELREALRKNLRDALSENLRSVTERIRPVCRDEEEVNAVAEKLSRIIEIRNRQNWANTNGFDPEKPIISARAVLREFRRPIPAAAGGFVS